MFSNEKGYDTDSYLKSTNKSQLVLYKDQNQHKWFLIHYFIFSMALLHGVVLLVGTVFLSIMFSHLKTSGKVQENNIQLLSYSWVTTPMSCETWINGYCVRSNDLFANSKDLGDSMQSQEIEQPFNGLFSSINAPFFALSSVVITTAFIFSQLAHVYDDNITPKMMKTFSLIILTVYGILFLFIQKEWIIPFNNLFLVSGLFLAAFLFINIFSISHNNVRIASILMNTLLAYPLLTISILSLLGEDDSVQLMVVFFSLLIFHSLPILLHNENSNEYEDNKVYNKKFMYNAIWLYWTSILPFLIQCGMKFSFLMLESPVSYPQWSVVTLIILFIYYIIEILANTYLDGVSTEYYESVFDINSSVVLHTVYHTFQYTIRNILVFLVIFG